MKIETIEKKEVFRTTLRFTMSFRSFTTTNGFPNNEIQAIHDPTRISMMRSRSFMTPQGSPNNAIQVTHDPTRISMMRSSSFRSVRHSCRVLAVVQLGNDLRPSSAAGVAPLALSGGYARTEEKSEQSYMEVSMSSKMSSKARSVR
ncbi:hypothetical protein ANANG_G00021980 [Anguilla anguilla]|uniref:Uncharacterized protein n=1 Tax=Anguilla anguilla TaxID=7936 RepID=A0A9D3SAR8_ANGAN|nr:hypothetical protein ANANG_G00021980 [Anguilla anguilla]